MSKPIASAMHYRWKSSELPRPLRSCIDRTSAIGAVPVCCAVLHAAAVGLPGVITAVVCRLCLAWALQCAWGCLPISGTDKRADDTEDNRKYKPAHLQLSTRTGHSI